MNGTTTTYQYMYMMHSDTCSLINTNNFMAFTSTEACEVCWKDMFYSELAELQNESFCDDILVHGHVDDIHVHVV